MKLAIISDIHSNLEALEDIKIHQNFSLQSQVKPYQNQSWRIAGE